MHHTMVPSDRVEHVAVHSWDGEKLGIIERLMLDKVSGTVAYAVIKTGGLLAATIIIRSCGMHSDTIQSARSMKPI